MGGAREVKVRSSHAFRTQRLNPKDVPSCAAIRMVHNVGRRPPAQGDVCVANARTKQVSLVSKFGGLTGKPRRWSGPGPFERQEMPEEKITPSAKVS